MGRRADRGHFPRNLSELPYSNQSESVTGKTPIREYAMEQMNHLLTNLAFQVHRAGKTPGPHEIHDVRVSSRLFAHGLIFSARFFPKSASKNPRNPLQHTMNL